MLVPIASLRYDSRNARRHDQRNIAAISAALFEFGQQKPVVATKDMVVIAGNGTLRAATQLGWTHLAVSITNLKPAQARAFAVADNRTAELAAWDPERLAEALEAPDLDELRGSMGFSEAEIAELLRQADVSVDSPRVEREPAGAPAKPDRPETEPQSVAQLFGEGAEQQDEPAAEPVAKVGDIWTLGRHEILVADRRSRGGAAYVKDSIAEAVVVQASEQGQVEHYQQLVKRLTSESAVVLDLIGGDGSLLMACELTGRSCRALIAGPLDADVVVTRWERQTGQKAERKRVTQRRAVSQSDFVYPPDMIYCGD
jgi:ParB-like chromosome segregation protein Spo0J